MTRRLDGPGLERGPQVGLTVDGYELRAYLGESVAAALLAAGIPATRTTRSGQPRGLYCGMGVCFDCLLTIDGRPNTRACMTWVRDGMVIERQKETGWAQSGGVPGRERDPRQAQ